MDAGGKWSQKWSICESGFMKNNKFPPPVIHDVVKVKISELQKYNFGYQMLPFEQGKDINDDVGL